MDGSNLAVPWVLCFEGVSGLEPFTLFVLDPLGGQHCRGQQLLLGCLQVESPCAPGVMHSLPLVVRAGLVVCVCSVFLHTGDLSMLVTRCVRASGAQRSRGWLVTTVLDLRPGV
jgi:hypothetical protein